VIKIMPCNTNRKAVAMIELIFSIVIIGIVMLSAPIMLTTATKSSVVTFQQESIAIVAAHANALMSYPWDEQNTESQSEYGILGTGTTTASLKRENNITAGMMRRQKGVPLALVVINASLPATFGAGETDPGTPSIETVKDDIDDFEGNISRLITADGATGVTNEGDYMDKNITISTHVRYYNDISSSPNFSGCQNVAPGCTYSNPTAIGGGISTNVKFISTSLTSINDDKNITMKMFMCNIGTAVPDKAIR